MAKGNGYTGGQRVGTASTLLLGDVLIDRAPAVGDPIAVTIDTNGNAQINHPGGDPSMPAPSAAVGAGIGTGGSPAATLDANATDACGQLTIKDGTSAWGTGAYATVTFGTAYKNAPYVGLTPGNAAAAAAMNANQVYVTSTTTGFSVNFGVADSASQKTFIFTYDVNGN